MDTFKRLSLIVVLFMSGCATTSAPIRPTAPPAPTWPVDVADECPTRTTSVECFRGSGFPKEAITQGMEQLAEAFRGCHLPGAEPVAFKVTIETLGGSASCVEPTVEAHETARCVAAVIARDLQLPGSAEEEHCRFTFPLRFE